MHSMFWEGGGEGGGIRATRGVTRQATSFVFSVCVHVCVVARHMRLRDRMGSSVPAFFFFFFQNEGGGGCVSFFFIHLGSSANNAGFVLLSCHYKFGC